MQPKPWIFENLYNQGWGGSNEVDWDERHTAEKCAREALKGSYKTVRYWDGASQRYLNPIVEHYHAESVETHYFNGRGVLVGRVYRGKEL